MEVSVLIDKCRSLGATFTTVGGSIKVQAPEPLPDNLIVALRQAKPQILVQLKQEINNQAECWMLEEWRKTSLPSWRRVLKVSIDAGNSNREAYARYMLREVLDDPEYKEKTND